MVWGFFWRYIICEPKTLNNILCTLHTRYKATCSFDVEVFMCEMMSSSYSAAMSNQHIKLTKKNIKHRPSNWLCHYDFDMCVCLFFLHSFHFWSNVLNGSFKSFKIFITKQGNFDCNFWAALIGSIAVWSRVKSSQVNWNCSQFFCCCCCSSSSFVHGSMAGIWHAKCAFISPVTHAKV